MSLIYSWGSPLVACKTYGMSIAMDALYNAPHEKKEERLTEEILPASLE